MISAQKTPWKCAGLIALAIGLPIAAFMMYVAWEHNPQGEFHEYGEIHWFDWTMIGFSWGVAISGPLFLLLGVGFSRLWRNVRATPHNQQMNQTSSKTSR